MRSPQLRCRVTLRRIRLCPVLCTRRVLLCSERPRATSCSRARPRWPRVHDVPSARRRLSTSKAEAQFLPLRQNLLTMRSNLHDSRLCTPFTPFSLCNGELSRDASSSLRNAGHRSTQPTPADSNAPGWQHASGKHISFKPHRGGTHLSAHSSPRWKSTFAVHSLERCGVSVASAC